VQITLQDGHAVIMWKGSDSRPA